MSPVSKPFNPPHQSPTDRPPPHLGLGPRGLDGLGPRGLDGLRPRGLDGRRHLTQKRFKMTTVTKGCGMIRKDTPKGGDLVRKDTPKRRGLVRKDTPKRRGLVRKDTPKGARQFPDLQRSGCTPSTTTPSCVLIRLHERANQNKPQKIHHECAFKNAPEDILVKRRK